MRHDRRGFTLLEILVVIGVIAVLATLLVLGSQALLKGRRADTTRMALSSLQGMLAEMDAKTRFAVETRPPQYFWGGTAASNLIDFNVAPFNDPSLQIDFWKTPRRNPLSAPPTGVALAIGAPAGVGENQPQRTGHWVVVNTAIAMSKLQSLQANRVALEKIAADRLMRLPADLPDTTSVNESQVPIPLDGWGNPIIYVPSSGLTGVALSNVTSGTVMITSTKVRSPTEKADSTDRPFFASAGPDGIFGFVDLNNNGNYDVNTDIAGGDDNIYSFEP